MRTRGRASVSKMQLMNRLLFFFLLSLGVAARPLAFRASVAI